jgi:fructosamine-3-kinase
MAEGDWPAVIEAALGDRPERITPLGGGCIADARRLEMPGGRSLVAKRAPVAHGGGTLALEGWMLSYLARHTALPVPAVRYCDDDLLVMDWLPGGGALNDAAQRHAADLVAALHDVSGPHFGFERDTLIGSLAQPNPPCDSWVAFFRDHRLRSMARVAHDAGRLPADVLTRVEAFAEHVDDFIAEPGCPGLIHGDLWGGNVLARNGRITGFIDPALYWADPEIELAFGTLFGTFGRPFFDRYGDLRPLRPGFFEERRDIYNLYPLLVHVRLFGGSYVGGVSRILGQFGY